MDIRSAAVSGMFYPSNPVELKGAVTRFLKASRDRELVPKVLVVPHAGYIYSGQVAAEAYKLLEKSDDKIERVILLGPCHRVPVVGVAIPSVSAFSTPLGDIPLDLKLIERINRLSFVEASDEAHELEHSLEVHLPFLQEVIGKFSLVPLVVGECSAVDVAKVLDVVWGEAETLIVISTDLSHFLSYNQAMKMDSDTAIKIMALESSLSGDEACGCRPLNGMLYYAKKMGLHIEQLALRNSGDTSGDKQRVVGYGSFALY
ncbi:AmmeMemoRadiSam system protein B [Gammaproteobacteria bacterium 45_16_T64]|nr:AmmeMemoRadiSam system protein B [Gammaproteobacteria bacterium 45_16_T64]